MLGFALSYESSASNLTIRPLIILGAARSGTKLLRTLLTKSPECAVIPHSLNDLWRTGLSPTASDRRSDPNGEPHVKNRIRARLSDFADQRADPATVYLVEKTCANTLRVPFVNAVLPDAHFIHIVRDGRDAATSAREKWTEGPDIRDVFRKLRSPSTISSLPWHVWNWWRGTDGLARWGPRYPGMTDDLQKYSLLEVCAQQWRACVGTCLNDLEELPTQRITTLHYEALVSNPTTFTHLIEALGLTDSASTMHKHYNTIVHQRSVSRWRTDLTNEEQEALNTCLGPTLNRISSMRTLSS